MGVSPHPTPRPPRQRAAQLVGWRLAHLLDKKGSPLRKLAPLAAALAVTIILSPTAQTAPGPGTTLEQTIVSTGGRTLTYGAGEKRVTRSLRWNRTDGSGSALGGFKQVSDVHVVDSESPG